MHMLDSAWATYLQLQNAVARRPRVDDYSYGLETGLNRLIELQSNVATLPFDAWWKLHARLPVAGALQTVADILSPKERIKSKMTIGFQSMQFLKIHSTRVNDCAGYSLRPNKQNAPSSMRQGWGLMAQQLPLI